MGTRITSKGQVTIPREIRQAAEATVGTELDWRYDPVRREIVATKALPHCARAADRFDKYRGCATGGLSTDEILALTREPPDP